MRLSSHNPVLLVIAAAAFLLRFRHPALAVIMTCVTCASTSAAPQEQVDDIHTRVKQGQKVSVTDSQGRVFKGSVLEVSADSLAMEIRRGRVDVRRAEILRIDRVDDLKNGALTGALVGAGLLVVDALVSREDGLYLTPAGYAVFAGIYCGLGAGAGAGIDALIGGNRNLLPPRRQRQAEGGSSIRAESERRVIGTVVVAGGGCVDAIAICWIAAVVLLSSPAFAQSRADEIRHC